MKLIEWNIHKMTNDIQVEPFVFNRILEQKADIICLVEYLDDIGIKKKLKREYWIEESVACSGNQILIAISRKIAPNGITLIRATEEATCYNFLHINFTNNNGKNFSVIGIRMLSPIDASKQTPPLNEYLSQIKESFICTGDFNIKGNRMSHWFPKFKIESLKPNEKEIDNSSLLYVNKNTSIINGFGDVDHVLRSKDLKITSEYKWDFIEDYEIYPEKRNLIIGKEWNIKPSYPDHAMMISEINVYEGS